MKFNKLLLLPFVTALLFGVVAVKISNHSIINDASSYHNTGIEIAATDFRDIPIHVPVNREPGYVLFLGGCYKLSKGFVQLF
jgi:hypothetical protein